MNVELVRKIKQCVLEEPNRLRMSEGIILGEPGTTCLALGHYGEPQMVLFAACGKIGCFAGWACLIGDPEFVKTLDHSWKSVNTKSWSAIRLRACELLDISYPQTWLFEPETWPNNFLNEYLAAGDNRQRAKVAGMVLDHFIVYCQPPSDESGTNESR